MQKSLPIWKFTNDCLRQHIPIMLLYVLASKGSSPGRQGFFMSVNANGEMQGSIGGGIMEHKFVELAKEKLRAGHKEWGVKKQIHDKTAAGNHSGMICSGEQTILLYPVHPKDAIPIQHIISSLENNKNGTLVLSPQGIQFDNTIPAIDFEYNYQSNDGWWYKEKTGYKNQLYIIGGGHCALAISKLMRGMDFYITLYEEREGLNTVAQNEYAHEIIIVEDYSALSYHIANGRNQYVVIMTVGYRTDYTALRSLLNKSFTYIGVLGSTKKMEKLFADYRRDGIAENVLQPIHTPVGIAIKSHTPEEIAVSIAAEIIAIKNQSL